MAALRRGYGVEGRGPAKRVRVKQLPHDWSEDDLLAVFESAGNIAVLTIFTTKDDRPTGTVLVEYDQPEGARRAVHELNGAVLGDVEIVVHYENVA